MEGLVRHDLSWSKACWSCVSQHHALSLCVSCLRGAASSLRSGYFVDCLCLCGISLQAFLSECVTHVAELVEPKLTLEGV